jgi:plastocyanin
VPRKLLIALAAPLGAAVVVMPAVAGSETSPKIEAVNGKGLYSHYWQPSSATIAPGGTVTISNSTVVKHGVEWVGGPAKPSCEPSVPVGNSEAASGTEWSGSCTFTAPGVYTFYCTVHKAEMTATVTVGSGGTTSTPTTPTQPPTSTQPSGTTTAGGGGSAGGGTNQPLAGPSLAASALKLAPAAHAPAVRGSLDVLGKWVGGRLEVDLLAGRASLARAGASALTRVGKLVRASLPAGPVTFKVPLNARARRALHARHRLALSVVVTLSSQQGAHTSATRRVVLHG